MRKEKRGLGVDRNGVQKMMRKRDYLADMSGQFGMNLVANLIGQLTYFYTDKVGLCDKHSFVSSMRNPDGNSNVCCYGCQNKQPERT